MAETLRDLVVSLSLESSNFSRNIKSVNAMIKEAQSQFDLAKAGVEGYEKSTEGAASKLSLLNTTLEKQKEIVKQYEGMLEQARLRLENSVATNEKLKASLEANNASLTAARTNHEQLKSAVESMAQAFGTESANYKSVKAQFDACEQTIKSLTEKHSRLEQQITANSRTMQTNADAVTRTNTSLNNANAAVKDTETAIADLTKQTSPAQQAWDSFKNSMSEAQAKLDVTTSGIKLTEAEFQNFAATTNAVPTSVEFLTEKLATLQQILGLQNQEVEQTGQILNAARGQMDLLMADVNTTGEAWMKQNEEVNKANIAYVEAQTAAANTQKAIDAVNAALSPATQAWNSYQQTIEFSNAMVDATTSGIERTTADFERYVAENGLAEGSVQYLTEALATQEAVLDLQRQKLAALGDAASAAQSQLTNMGSDASVTTEQWLAQQAAVNKAETEYTKMATAVANTKATIADLRAQLSPAGQAFSSYQQTIDRSNATANAAASGVELLNSEFKRFVAESGAAEGSVQYLTEALATQEAVLIVQQEQYTAMGTALESMRNQLVVMGNDEKTTTDQWMNQQAAINKAETEYNNLGAAIANTKSGITDLKSQLSDEQQAWNVQDEAIRKANEALASIAKQTDVVKSSYALLQATTKETDGSLQAMRDELYHLKGEYELQNKAVEEYAKVLAAARAQLDLAVASGDADKIRTATDAVNEAKAALNNAKAAAAETGSNIADLQSKVSEAATSWSRFSSTVDEIGNKLISVGDTATVVGETLTNSITKPLAELAQSSVSASTKFESSFTTVRQTTDATEEQYAELSQAAKDMSEQLGMTSASIADTMAEAGRLGIKAESLVDFTTVVEKMSMTFGLSATDAATSVARFMTVMGTDVSEITNYGSAVTYLANNYATTADEIISLSQGLAGAGKTVGMSSADILGISTALSSVGITAARGASTFSQALIKIETAVSTNSDKLAEFASVAGMTAEEFAEAWRADATGTFTQFILGLASMDESTRSTISALQDCGISTIRLTDSFLRITNNTENFTNAIVDSNAAWAQNTELEETAQKRIATTATQTANFTNKIENLKIKIGDDLKPTLISFLNVGSDLLDWLDNMDDGSRKLVETLAAVAASVGPVIIVFGALASGLGNGIIKIKNMVGAISAFLTAGGAATLGVAALAAAVVAGTFAFADWASGAKAARDAAGELSDAVDDLKENGFKGIYSTSGNDMLAAFGISSDAFENSSAETADWFDSLIKTWTDGKSETDEIMNSYIDSFTTVSDGVREQISGQKSLLEGYGILDEDTLSKMEADEKTLDEIDSEVTKLLKKRQNGTISEDEQARLQELLQLREEINERWGGTATAEASYDGIQQQLDADIEKAKTMGETLDPSRYGEALTAISQGYQAVQDQLAASYDEEYAQVMAITDEEERELALGKLDEKYWTKRVDAAKEYKEQLAETAGKTFADNGLDKSMDDLTSLAGVLEEIRTSSDNPGADSISAVTDWVNGMGSDGIEKLQSLYSIIQQLQGTGMDNDEIANALGIKPDELESMLTTMNKIKEIADGTDSLSGLSDLFTTLDENAGEVLTLTLGIDSEQASADITAFMEQYKDTSVNVTVAVENLNEDAITAWNSANSNVKLTGPMATVGVQLGENAAATIQSAWNASKLAVYGSDGLPLEITPEVLKLITSTDVCAYDEDGTLHVMITPEVGTTEYVDYTQEQGEQDQSFMGIDIGSTQDQIDKINSYVSEYNTAMENYEAAKAAADASDNPLVKDQKTTESTAWLDDAQAQLDGINQIASSLTDTDLENIGQQIMALYSALSNPDLDDTTRADLQAQLDNLLSVVDQLDATESGSQISAGIADGMTKYGWAGSASTLASGIHTAVNNALQEHSPSRLMRPSGTNVSAGVAAGMTEYSFAGSAATVSSSIYSSMSAVLNNRTLYSLGTSMMSGLAAGIRQGKSGVLSALTTAVTAAVIAAKALLKINSPSRVFRDEVGAMMMKGLGVGFTEEAKQQAKVIQNASRYLTNEAAGTVTSTSNDNRRTYNQQSSVTLNVDGLSVRSDADVRNLAIEIAALTKRSQQMKGA